MEEKKGVLDSIDPKMLARIQALRLMDDDFMTIVFAGDNKLTEMLLRILLSRDDLHVKSSMTQKTIHNLFGRSVRLDILAEDTSGRLYNVEIQRADKGADPERARLNQSQIDAHTIAKGTAFSKLPETYIIFITENDFYGANMPVYEVEKTIKGLGVTFDDGTHTIYVNGAYRADDAIGHLMHDFCTAKADEMYYSEIAARVRFHKQETKGVDQVSRIWEEYGDERAEAARIHRNIEVAEDLLRQNKLSTNDIAAVAKMSVAQVQKIAAQLRS